MSSSSLKTRLTQGLIWGQIGRLLETLLQFGFSFLVIRQLPIADYGYYGLTMGLATVFALGTSFGLGESAKRFLPEYAATGQPGRARYLLDRLLSLRALAIAVCAAIFMLAHGPIQRSVGLAQTASLAGIIVAMGAAISLEELLGNVLTAQYDLRALYRVRVATRIFNLAAAVALLKFATLRLEVVLLILLLSQSAGVAVLWRMRHQPWRAARAEAVAAGPALRFGITTWTSQFLTFVLESRSDVMLLGLLIADPQQVAFYNAGAALIAASAGMVLATSVALALPSFSDARTRGPAALAQTVESFWKMMIVTGVPICCFAFVLATPVAVHVLGARYAGAGDVLRIFGAAGVLALLIGQGILTSLLYALDLQKKDLMIRAAGATANVALALAMIPRWGAAGAAAASGITALVIFAAEAWFARRALQFHFPWSVATKVLLLSSAGCLLVRALPLGNLLELLLAGAGYVALLLVALSFVKILEPRDRDILKGMKSPVVQFIAARY